MSRIAALRQGRRGPRAGLCSREVRHRAAAPTEEAHRRERAIPRLHCDPLPAQRPPGFVVSGPVHSGRQARRVRTSRPARHGRQDAGRHRDVQGGEEGVRAIGPRPPRPQRHSADAARDQRHGTAEVSRRRANHPPIHNRGAEAFARPLNAEAQRRGGHERFHRPVIPRSEATRDLPQPVKIPPRSLRARVRDNRLVVACIPLRASQLQGTCGENLAATHRVLSRELRKDATPSPGLRPAREAASRHEP